MLRGVMRVKSGAPDLRLASDVADANARISPLLDESDERRVDTCERSRRPYVVDFRDTGRFLFSRRHLASIPLEVAWRADASSRP